MWLGAQAQDGARRFVNLYFEVFDISAQQQYIVNKREAELLITYKAYTTTKIWLQRPRPTK